MHRGHHRRGPRSRNRRLVAPGVFEVRTRIERLGEAALLLLLSERPTHGYELLDALPQLTREERVDVGNLYRVLRALEDEGLVRSEWSSELPGPAKRTYWVTDDGRAALAAWLEALVGLRADLDVFLERAKGGEEHART